MSSHDEYRNQQIGEQLMVYDGDLPKQTINATRKSVFNHNTGRYKLSVWFVPFAMQERWISPK